ncbi:serine/threonine-protein kinase SMG1-like [Ipomoea triloba]|uniref:serine/threonine-protein kinase SMG1-like n=1 Tax=Ipomoea triloba TaxID=35885 RepID=UPI00125D56C4|nr:serine/threonine-protein kinase SMG1-like [Ipomoea triloba]XP_031125881.1 serine/threonine-protein kinase SMG1-like [Ipomoea triloba]XP_031125882.1 serine/threonine-protein kinase SMG1-like [Ipomoea triloba]XP_031125883.1 serine/threonine-protein kinase SMG1-like [Ipomoea triloba]
MMQGLHHQQQQLAALLAAALPKDDTSKSTPLPPLPQTPSSSTPSSSAATTSEEDESSRIAALTSLHRTILYPPNSLLVTHSASFLAQGFSQLLSDKCYSVRHPAATAYGALCAVLCSISMGPNGRQNHVILGSLVDRFIGWALPLLGNVGDGSLDVALEGLREFLSIGDVGAVERFALPILKACQELLEDERTSFNLLRRLLDVLTLISLKFFRCFQPHFVDIVDLLLGWVLVPDLADTDRRVIMDSFLQFQKYWVNNMQFSLGLLSKFLGDMDVLLQDGSPGTLQQFQRLLALLSCFSTVLQSMASGLLEINMLEKINEPLCKMVPILLGCISLIGRKFGWSKWIEDSWKCLTLLAEILREHFSPFYSIAVDILFQSLDMEGKEQFMGSKKLTSFQVHGILKTNLQLLSLQKLGLSPSSVHKILQFTAPISKLRLHPNHLVTGSSAATYIFLLQHGNNEVIEMAVSTVLEELEPLKQALGETLSSGDMICNTAVPKSYSKSELVALIKFDLRVLSSCVSLPGCSSFIGQGEIDTLYVSRSEKLISCIIDRLDPFNSTIQNDVELQVTVLKTLERLAEVEFLCKCSLGKERTVEASLDSASQNSQKGDDWRHEPPVIILQYLKKFSVLLAKAIHHSSPLALKIEGLQWMHKFCGNVISIYDNSKALFSPCEAFGYVDIFQDLLFSILDAASDREHKVRSLVASVLEMLLQAKLIHPIHFIVTAETVLEKLGDPDTDIKNVFVRVLSNMLPLTVYLCGLNDNGLTTTYIPGDCRISNRTNLHWKQLFALKPLPQQLHSQQLVSILSYIAQRWKVPLSSWIQRLICSCQRSNNISLTQLEEAADVGPKGLLWDIKVDEDTLERACSANILAGAWWAIHEAARYCITTRLRTNLGGPTQTFAALERMLLDVANVLELDADQSDGSLNIISSSYAHLLPMRLLLDFVEALKKNVYNAYEGSLVLPCPSRQSSLFFRANKKVCEEWFSRICEPMMNAGLALHCHDATIHYCALRLQELRNLVALSMRDKSRAQVNESLHSIRVRFAGDIMRVLRHIALALSKNHEPEVLIGIKKWATTVFSPLFIDENQTVNDRGTLGYFSWISGLVYQAKGQHEKAAAHFIHLLQTEDSLTFMGSDGVQFAITRIIESYVAVSDWKSLESWLLELQTLRAKHAGKSYSGALTTAGNEINSIQALARFDEGELQAAWACLDLTPKSSSELTLDPKLALQRSEQMLLQAMLHQIDGKVDKVSHELQKAKSMLEEPLSVLPLDGLSRAAPYVNQLYCLLAFEECFKLKGAQNQHFPSLLNSYLQTMHSPINQIHQDCNIWLKVLRVYRAAHPTLPSTLKLCMNVMSLARKQGNLMLANRLEKYLIDNISSCPEGSIRDHIISSLNYEQILLMFAENKIEDAFTSLWSFLRPCMVSPSVVSSDCVDNALKAKACLKLSHWLRQDYSDARLEDIVLKMKGDFYAHETYCGKEGSSFNNDQLTSKENMNLIYEEIVGTATKLSSRLCPTMGKSWISYASWCFTQARSSLLVPVETALQSCTFSPILTSELLPGRFGLTKEEFLKVKDIIFQLLWNRSLVKELNENAGDFDVSFISSEHIENEGLARPLLQQVVDIIESEAGASGAEDFCGECLSATVTSKLQKCFATVKVPMEEASVISLIGDLVDIWWSLRRRRVSLFGHAAQAFMNFLSHASSRSFDGQLTGFDKVSKYKSTNYTLKATLYVLHILVNFGPELKDTLGIMFSAVPLLPWQEITPQLFARLCSHPEQVVRKQVESLLVMLAKLSPWSVVYPTLVDANSCEKKPPEELQRILACLNELYPRLVQDVQMMIKELENVTVLWEELWLSTLQDLHADVMRRINLLKEEAARIAENATLSHGEKSKINAAKYSAMMAPIVVVLERRLASTSRKPETPHEMWFHDVYKEQIKSAILNFKIPPASSAALGDVWQPFNNIAASLASYQRKSSISLGEVAPQLALLSSSDAPMPGLEKQITISESEEGNTAPKGIVRIASFSDQITILSTKTKPKKLLIVGSDGEKYIYLLKGREDLRLDARIMQLLQAINGFLHSSSVTYGQSVGIRFYSVTPISGRAGLIQWVDNVVSIYSVFKSWQNRVQVAELSAMGANAKHMVPPPIPRPMDMFYGKIIPALKEKGIRKVISRRDWPHEVKRKVLLDLMKETPNQLLYNELWCASDGFRAFHSKQKRYSGTLAAMSIVGHILGLGDRHLDNILIDFCTGDIVHIDYNVCFDKGQRLKIPEIVPFRLTQTIEAALGLTGVEGTFRANCEAVLGVLKKNKDIILMLLEVFVWDPLVDWTRGDFHDDAAIFGEERKGMELAVSLSLFASRMQEIRVPLQEHHDLLLASLPAVESAIERFTSILNQYEIVSALFYHADQERSNLVLQETSVKSIVAEATSNSDKIQASLQIQAREFAQAQAMVVEKAQEATTWIEQHVRVLDAIRSSSIPEINAHTTLTDAEQALSLTSAVLVAGVPLTIVPEPTLAQCQDIDREVSQLVAELDHGLSSAISALQTYSLALQRILPLNYHTTNPVHGWSQILQLAVNNLSSDILSLSRRQASELIGKVHVDKSDTLKIRYDELCFKVGQYAAEIGRLEEECAELVNSIGQETEIKAKDCLFSAFLKYMQSTGLERKEDSNKLGSLNLKGPQDAGSQEKFEVNKEKLLTVLSIAVSSLYSDVKHKLVKSITSFTGTEIPPQSNLGAFFCEFEEQIEKCMLIAGFLNEVQQYIGTGFDSATSSHEVNWASVFKTSLLSCKSLVREMVEYVLPEVIRTVILFNSEILDVFGSLSQIRGSIDTALEQLIEVELERASLVELEQNYFVKVGLITEQQLALEEASIKGRDHLSWEEAEELASQEEACRAQLDKLHRTWNQKDLRTSSLMKKETNIRSALVSSEHHLQSLITTEEDREPHALRSRALLAALLQPFSELESVDRTLSSLGAPIASRSSGISHLANSINSGSLISGYIWNFPGIISSSHAFLIWKISLVDSFLDSCVHDAALPVAQTLGFDQLVDVVKKKLEPQLQKNIGEYLRERVAPVLLERLEKEIESLKHMTESRKDFTFDQIKNNFGAIKEVQIMLEEYCNAHETVRAATSAVSVMKRQVNELKDNLLKTSLEIVQMEWMHDMTVNPLQNNRLMSHKFLASSDKLVSILLNISRPKLLESLQSSIAKIAKSLEGIQACERTFITAEGQLERAMGWACGGASTSAMGNTSARNSGIPPEFHEHLIRRRQLLSEAREKASDVMKLCISILEFEVSRDGFFRTSEELCTSRTNVDGRLWEQAYLNAITKLDVTFHSFTRTEQEWKLAQSNMEIASSSLFTATNEVCIASVKAKSASGDLQNTLLAMRDCACEASVALSAFGNITRGHTALTSECGSMLEEVLAVTEGVHDVHSIAKEAVALHSSMMEDLSKACAILLPLETVLSKDVTAMTEALAKERETKTEISPVHGQAMFQSYHSRIKDTYQAFKPLVPSVTSSVEGLLSMLTNLARSASLHAGNLHKALEGLGESQEVRSQDLNPSKSDIFNLDNMYNSKNEIPESGETGENFFDVSRLSLHDKGWISPPESITSCSSDSCVTSSETSLADTLNGPDIMDPIHHSVDGREGREHSLLSPSVGIPLPEMSPSEQSRSQNIQETSGLKLLPNIETSLSTQERVEDNSEAPVTNTEASCRTRGKNPYAVSVLRRMEMKLDGRDIVDDRELSVGEQVDYLLKQATSIDNLCNMYEGWTPWI